MGFRDDDRGQSIQVGAILMFAVLVILLATYQTTVVPNDNRSAEFDHSLGAEEDLLDVRNAILRSYQTGETAPETVKLGMTYPRHSLGVNPAPVGGTLRTAQGGTVSVTDTDGTVDACPVSSETKTMNYSAGYNYLQPSPTLVYENTVLYADYGDGNRVMISDQSLVQGDKINLIALRGNYSENGIGVTDIQPQAGQYRSTPTENATIEVPTRLSESQWKRLLDGEVQDPDNVTVQETAEGRILRVELTGSYDVRCGLVGANSVPEGGPRGEEGGTDINPAGPGDVRVENIRNNGPKSVRADFNNTANNPANITKARLAFYYGNKKEVNSITFTDLGPPEETYGPYDPAGPIEPVDPVISIPANDRKTLEFTANLKEGKNMKGDYFIMQFEFENGKQGTYFISVPN